MNLKPWAPLTCLVPFQDLVGGPGNVLTCNYMLIKVSTLKHFNPRSLGLLFMALVLLSVPFPLMTVVLGWPWTFWGSG